MGMVQAGPNHGKAVRVARPSVAHQEYVTMLRLSGRGAQRPSSRPTIKVSALPSAASELMDTWEVPAWASFAGHPWLWLPINVQRCQMANQHSFAVIGPFRRQLTQNPN